MKKFKISTVAAIAVYAMLVAGVSSCTRGDELKNVNKFERYEVIEIDGCEYIQYGSAYGMLHVTHKGNCKNVIHACH